LIDIQKGDIISFTYKNWKGEIAERTAIFLSLSYGSNEFHKKPKLIVRGFDLDKLAERTFTAKDMTDITITKR
jgi:hypothetical protein